MAKVFIAQEPMFKRQGLWVSKGLDIASANRYGDVVIVWGPDASILSRDLIEEEAVRLADKYNDAEDYVVALGSPTLISVLAWAIGRAGKSLRVLEWDKDMRSYYPTLGTALYDVIS